MAQTIEQFTAVLKDRIAPHVDTIVHSKTSAKKYFGEGVVFKGNKEMSFKQSVQAIWAYGAATQKDVFKHGTPPKFEEYKIFLKMMMSSIYFDFETIHHQGGDYLNIDKYKHILNLFMVGQTIIQDMYYWGRGDSVLSTVTGVASNVLTVQNTTHAHIGMPVLVITSGSSTISNLYIEDVDHVDKTITLDNATGVDVGSTLYYQRSYDANNSKAPIGINAHISTTNLAAGTYQGVDRTSQTLMKCVEVDGATPGTPETFNPNRLRELFDRMTTHRASDFEKPDVILICNNGVYNNIYDKLQTLQSPMIHMSDKFGQQEYIKFIFNGREYRISVDPLATSNTLLALDRSTMKVFKGPSGIWMPNGKALQPTADALGYYQVGYGYWQTYCSLPSKNGRLNDLTETLTA